MYPHHKLDWNLSRLEGRLEAAPDDATARLDYAEHCLSKAMFHQGGEPWYNRGLTQARRVLGGDPTNVGAMVIAGVALVGLERTEPASRYLDQALREDHRRADVHFGLGCLHEVLGDRHQALREFEMACRLAPESFEGHYKLAMILWARARELGTPKRLLERSQFHTTKALTLDPTPAVALDLQFHLAMTALHAKRWTDAHKMLLPLLDTNRAERVKYSIGVASYHLGKHKNAILYLRQHLDRHPEDPRVHTRIGMSYLQLGEFAKARKACNRALAVDPSNTDARWTLGCALIEEGQVEDATQVFKELLADEPEHIPAFTELVRLRVGTGDLKWLQRALRTEVSGFDRLPVRALMEGPHGDRPVTPRAATRNRIAILLKALGQARRPGHNAVGLALSCMALTTDEGLRYLLWEAGVRFSSESAASRVVQHLDKPGVHFDPAVARELLALTDLVPEDLVTQGLNVREEDLNRAAVDRHGPARDLSVHRKRIEAEREIARAWQAQLLLAVGERGSTHGHNLLVRWEAEADRDLAIAARAALALREDEAVDRLRNDARRQRAEPSLDALVAGRAPAMTVTTPRPLPEDSVTPCSTCGRRVRDAGHVLGGSDGAVCDTCMTEIASHRRELATDDPAAECVLCHKTNTSTKAVFVYQAVNVCSDCLDRSLGLVERETVDAYFVSLRG